MKRPTAIGNRSNFVLPLRHQPITIDNIRMRKTLIAPSLSVPCAINMQKYIEVGVAATRNRTISTRGSAERCGPRVPAGYFSGQS
jgi:hypothetical protein